MESLLVFLIVLKKTSIIKISSTNSIDDRAISTSGVRIQIKPKSSKGSSIKLYGFFYLRKKKIEVGGWVEKNGSRK